MLLFSPVNWRYYGGWTAVARMHGAVCRSCMIVCRVHDPVLVAHGAFYWQTTLTTHIEDMRFWSESEGGYLLSMTLTGRDRKRLLGLLDSRNESFPFLAVKTMSYWW
ncbi:MAG: hypothetical protein ACTSXC_08380 [Candidatus Freyarchaeota archaeon]